MDGQDSIESSPRAGSPAPAPPALSLAFSRHELRDDSSMMHPLKRASLALVRHPLWESFILVAIFISSVTLAIDEPRLEPSGALKHALTTSNYLFTLLFTLEVRWRSQLSLSACVH